jgi:hypothetical protein
MVAFMIAIPFDTLKMVETLQAGGLSDQQARAVTTALGNAGTVAQVATRGDVMELGIGMKHDFDRFRAESRADFDAFKSEIRHEFDAFKTEVRHDFKLFKTEIRRTEALWNSV